MNNLFELDEKWKNIIDYDDTFLKDYEIGTDNSTDKIVVAFLNDMCNNLTNETFIEDSKVIDPKPYIRLLENCNKEVLKKLTENSLDNYKHTKGGLNEREFEETVKPNFDLLKKNFAVLEQKINKTLVNNNNKGLLSLIQNLQLKLERNNSYKHNVELLKHYLYFYKIAEENDVENRAILDDLYDSKISSIYKFEISELDKVQIERQSIMNKDMSVVLERLMNLSKKLEQKNAKLVRVSNFINFIKTQFETSILEDFTLLHENLYNNVEHDSEVIYLGLNLIIDIYNKMNMNKKNNLIDIFVDKHPLLSNINANNMSQFSSSLMSASLPRDLRDIDTYEDSKFVEFLDNNILKIIYKEGDIIKKIFDKSEKLYLDTTSKLVVKIMMDKVKPLALKIISDANERFTSETYLVILNSLYNSMMSRFEVVNEKFNFCDDLSAFIKVDILNYNKRQFQLDLNKTLNILFDKDLTYIIPQRLPASSLNGLKDLMKKNENKDFIEIVKQINLIHNEENNNKLQNLGQKTMTQFSSLLKHNENDTTQGSLANVKMDISSFSILKFMDNLKYIDFLQKEFLKDDIEVSKGQMMVLFEGMVEEYMLKNFEIFYHINNKDIKTMSNISDFFALIDLAESQIIYFYNIIGEFFGSFSSFGMLEKLENCINVLFIQYLLQFNDSIEKLLKTQNRKDYLIDSRNALVNEGTQSFNNLEKYMNDLLVQFVNIKSTSMTNFIDMLLQNLYKHLLKNYKKFDVNIAGGLVMNKDILNLYNCLEHFSPDVVKVEALNKFKLLKELVGIFSMRDLNNVRYLIDNSIYLKKSSEVKISDYIKRRV